MLLSGAIPAGHRSPDTLLHFCTATLGYLVVHIDKGVLYALLHSLDFGLGVLEHALMLGGSKIALFFT